MLFQSWLCRSSGLLEVSLIVFAVSIGVVQVIRFRTCVAIVAGQEAHVQLSRRHSQPGLAGPLAAERGRDAPGPQPARPLQQPLLHHPRLHCWPPLPGAGGGRCGRGFTARCQQARAAHAATREAAGPVVLLRQRIGAGGLAA